MSSEQETFQMLAAALILHTVLGVSSDDGPWVVSDTVEMDLGFSGIASLHGELAQLAWRRDRSMKLVVYKGAEVSYEIELRAETYLAGRRTRGELVLAEGITSSVYEIYDSTTYPSKLNPTYHVRKILGDLMFMQFTGGTLIRNDGYLSVWADDISDGTPIIDLGSDIYAVLRRSSITRLRIVPDSPAPTGRKLTIEEISKHELKLAESGEAVEFSTFSYGYDTDFDGNVVCVVTMPEQSDLDLVTLYPSWDDTEVFEHELVVLVDPETGLCTPIVKLAYRSIPNSISAAGQYYDSIAVLGEDRMAVFHQGKISILERKRETTRIEDPSYWQSWKTH